MPEVGRALLVWLVVYVGMLAMTGFVLFVVRSSGGRSWSDHTLLRTASFSAFVLSAVFWLWLVWSA